MEFVSLIIIALAVLSFKNNGFRFWNIVLFIIGAWIFIGELGLFRHHTFLILIALSLVAFGVWIIIHAVAHPGYSNSYNNANVNASDHDYVKADNSDYVKYESYFTTNSFTNASKCFKGGYVSTDFGRMRLDMSQIEIQGEALLDVSAVFGTIEIIIPRNIPYRTKVTPVLGSFVNNAPLLPPAPGVPYLEIKGSAVFGTCTIY